MEKYPQLNLNADQGPRVQFQTSQGLIVLQLFAHEAPLAVENFISLVKKHYYDQTSFHRVIDNFMIQGGDPTGTGEGGTSIWGHPFQDEISPRLYHFRGAVALANDGPNSNISQFFIVQNYDLPAPFVKEIESFVKEIESYGYAARIIEKYKHGGAPWLDGHFTIFGQVVRGMNSVDKIAQVKTNLAGKPMIEHLVHKVTII